MLSKLNKFLKNQRKNLFSLVLEKIILEHRFGEAGQQYEMKLIVKIILSQIILTLKLTIFAILTTTLNVLIIRSL